MILPYLNKDVAETESPTGVKFIDGVDSYRGVNIRNVQVCRYDLIGCLIGEVFNEDTYNKYRAVFLMLLAGTHTDDVNDGIVSLFKSLYIEDSVFKLFFSRIVYFPPQEYADMGIYERTIKYILKLCETHKRKLYDCSLHIRKVIGESGLYLYVSVPKGTDYSKVKYFEGVSV